MIISLRTAQYDALRTSIYATNAAMGEAAADEARDIIAAAIKTKGRDANRGPSFVHHPDRDLDLPKIRHTILSLRLRPGRGDLSLSRSLAGP